MTSARKYKLVLVTSPDLRTARKLARTALDQHLAACVNLIPKIESHYWWKGKLERGSEILLLLKTSAAHLPSLEKLILESHPYETPEFLVLQLEHGNESYLKWLGSSLTRESQEPKGRFMKGRGRPRPRKVGRKLKAPRGTRTSPPLHESALQEA